MFVLLVSSAPLAQRVGVSFDCLERPTEWGVHQGYCCVYLCCVPVSKGVVGIAATTRSRRRRAKPTPRKTVVFGDTPTVSGDGGDPTEEVPFDADVERCEGGRLSWDLARTVMALVEMPRGGKAVPECRTEGGSRRVCRAKIVHPPRIRIVMNIAGTSCVSEALETAESSLLCHRLDPPAGQQRLVTRRP